MGKGAMTTIRTLKTTSTTATLATAEHYMDDYTNVEEGKTAEHTPGYDCWCRPRRARDAQMRITIYHHRALKDAMKYIAFEEALRKKMGVESG